MEKEFIPYEEALALKELECYITCMASYDSMARRKHFDYWQSNAAIPLDDAYKGICTAPLYQQAFRWFREKHNLHVSSTRYSKRSVKEKPLIFPALYDVDIHDDNNDEIIIVGEYNTYEEMELESLRKLIKIVKLSLP